MIVQQTGAIFLEAYRELNARKLFWVVLSLSGLVVLAMGSVGIDESGITLLGYEILPGVITTAQVPRDAFYKFLFVSVGVPVWLTWAATILALVSTAGVIPDMLQAGAIDVVLSKPISRVRLYVTKYFSALLFAGLQVVVFSAASFLVIGLRGESWEWKVFLAVPLVLCFYSYIYCVCALVGLLTRSTMTALLAAIGFWMLVFASHATEQAFLAVKATTEIRVTALAADVKARQERLAEREEAAARGEPAAGEGRANGKGVMGTIVQALKPAENLEREREAVERAQERLEKARATLRKRQKGHAIAMGVKSVLPKTSETMQILQRELLSLSELAAITQAGDDPVVVHVQEDGEDEELAALGDQRGTQDAVTRVMRGRSVWWIIGTSLLFEALVVGASARVFSRRDF